MTPSHSVVTARVRRHRAERRRSEIIVVSILIFAFLVGVVTVIAVLKPTARQDYTIDDTVGLDFLTRTDASGWGTAQVGGDYSLSTPGSFSVAGSAGIIRLDGQTPLATATLDRIDARNVLGSATVNVDSLPADGQSVSAGVELRRTATASYRAVATMSATGAVALSAERLNRSTGVSVELASKTLSVNAVDGSKLVIELRVTGSAGPVSLDARAWLDDGQSNTVEVEATDAGSARISSPGAAGVVGQLAGDGSFDLALDDLKFFDVSKVATTVQRVPTADAGFTPVAVPVSGGAGTPTVGSLRYVIPTAAVFVAPNGDDDGDGSVDDPFRSLVHAVDVSHPGSTIVLRGGRYHEETVVRAGKSFTIQPYPGEAVWFDGAERITNWKSSGGRWVSAGWNTDFDSSPTYTQGVVDGSDFGWKFLSKKYPLAAHPDQTWIDGRAQKQVRSLSQVVAGTFFVDTAKHRLYLGSDPAGKRVEGSTLQRAFALRSSNTVLRGIGVERYAPSVPQLGAITAETAQITIESVAIVDSATTGLFVRGDHSIVHDVTIAGSGLLGFSAAQADVLDVRRLLAVGNNTEHFNISPVSGGMKVTRSRHLVVADSVFTDNLGQGLWFDESSYDGLVVGNTITGSSGHGLIVEISAKFIIANNLILDNGMNGMKINDTSDVQIWNNTVSGNSREINIVQDTRRASNRSTPGHDPRASFPDPTMTWITGPVTVRNNVLAGTSGNCLLCVEDYSKEYTAEQLGVTSDGDVFQRETAAAPQWVAVWSKGDAVNPAVFETLGGFSSATGQESDGQYVEGSPVLGSRGAVLSGIQSSAGSKATPLTASIARLVGQPAGTRHLGAWR
jgi:parallel beta-helix repeat protein